MVYSEPKQNEDNRNHLDDSELMIRISLSDRSAFTTLVHRHLVVMVVVATRITGNRQEAENIVQEAFLKVWLNAGKWQIDGAAQFKTWFRKIIVNMCIDQLRRKTFLPWEAAGDPEDENEDSFEGMADKQKAQVLRSCIQKLPIKQKVAVTLFYLDDLSGKEVANIMNVTVGALESLLVRARNRLKKQLKKQGVEVWGDL